MVLYWACYEPNRHCKIHDIYRHIKCAELMYLCNRNESYSTEGWQALYEVWSVEDKQLFSTYRIRIPESDMARI